jgi:hypothetical protein
LAKSASESVLEDPLYLGLSQHRVRGEEYAVFVGSQQRVELPKANIRPV